MDYNSLSTRFACPFRLCTKTYARKNELKVHVAKARLKKGDDCHPENDHLWDNPYVQSLLVFGTHARTPAEKRQKRRERNERYRRKNEWRQNLKVFSANTSAHHTLELAQCINTYEKLYAQFNALHTTHQNRTRAINILRKLQQKKIPIRFGTGMLDTIQSNNMFPLIEQEVKQAPSNSIRFRDIMSHQEQHSKKLQFLAAFSAFQSNVGHDPHDSSARAYCIWDLPLATNSALRSLMLIPDEYQQGYIFKTIDDQTRAITITITPPGTIADCHLDQTGSGTLLTQLLGSKLFIIWPPTAKNLAWFSNKYGLNYGTMVDAALEELESPFCLFLEQGQYYLLGPGYIHAVLSPMNSAIAGVPVVHSNLRSEAEIAMAWESDLLERRKDGTPLERATVDNIERGLQEDRLLWNQLDMLEQM